MSGRAHQQEGCWDRLRVVCEHERVRRQILCLGVCWHTSTNVRSPNGGGAIPGGGAPAIQGGGMPTVCGCTAYRESSKAEPQIIASASTP